ncbi:hypothetical protein P2318_07010 [Myxococcaceae bacterium GXIMD 01537]
MFLEQGIHHIQKDGRKGLPHRKSVLLENLVGFGVLNDQDRAIQLPNSFKHGCNDDLRSFSPHISPIHSTTTAPMNLN